MKHPLKQKNATYVLVVLTGGLPIQCECLQTQMYQGVKAF